MFLRFWVISINGKTESRSVRFELMNVQLNYWFKRQYNNMIVQALIKFELLTLKQDYDILWS